MRNYQSLAEVRSDIKEGKTTVQALVNYYLERINANTELNAFIEVYSSESQERAKLIDDKIANGTAGKLAGMVISIKDMICYKNHKVSASSKILEGFESLFSSTVVERILAEDAIIIGRVNCDEFAMGASNETSHYGSVKNYQNTKNNK